ncbi:MAG: hypothetical protein NUW01_19100 [Gemmatimonadaceae bacterium]|nr:hypothetical protein [Gemmatimonadaceae bacterium]
MVAPDLPAEDLIAAVMAKLDAPNASQLADKLGMTRRNQDKTVARWIKGQTQPNYDHTLMLLSALDLLRPDAEEILRAAAAEAHKAEIAARRLDGGAPPRGKRATG